MSITSGSGAEAKLSATKRRMIDVAERLFAEQGINAVPLSAVVKASGQKNRSAAQYHFQSKDGLVRAILAARQGANEDRRSSRIAALKAQGEPYRARDLLSVWVVPLVQGTVEADGGSWYLRFVARVLTRSPEMVALFVPGWLPQEEGSGLDWMLYHLRQAFLHLDDETFKRRMRWAMASTLQVLGDFEAAWSEGRATGEPEQVVEEVLAMCCALLEAPDLSGTGDAEG